VAVSYCTEATPVAKLSGLVYGATTLPDDGAASIWQKPIFWAVVVIVIFFILNIVFF
jgi:SSS family solute:Na+ symporter